MTQHIDQLDLEQSQMISQAYIEPFDADFGATSPMPYANPEKFASDRLKAFGKHGVSSAVPRTDEERELLTAIHRVMLSRIGTTHHHELLTVLRKLQGQESPIAAVKRRLEWIFGGCHKVSVCRKETAGGNEWSAIVDGGLPVEAHTANELIESFVTEIHGEDSVKIIEALIELDQDADGIARLLNQMRGGNDEQKVKRFISEFAPDVEFRVDCWDVRLSSGKFLELPARLQAYLGAK